MFAPENAADFMLDRYFSSNDRPCEWICWNFGQKLIGLTHYTIKALGLKSWVLEGSMDGASWMATDWQMDRHDFDDAWNAASFPASVPGEFRFIRLTQTDTAHKGENLLALHALEFFGTLSE
jgi:hypothetical protein